MDDIVKPVVERAVLSKAADYFARKCISLKTMTEPKEPGNGEGCDHHPWDLFQSPCAICGQMCNCAAPEDKTPYTDVLVTSLENQVVPLSASLVQASLILSREFNDALKKGENREDGERLHKGDFMREGGKQVRVLFDQEPILRPTIGVPAEILLKIDRYITAHLEKVVRNKKLVRDLNEEENSLGFEDWESAFFDVGPAEMLGLLQANLELCIWDLHFVLQKWQDLNTGIPKYRANFNQLCSLDGQPSVVRSQRFRCRTRNSRITNPICSSVRRGAGNRQRAYTRKLTAPIIPEIAQDEECNHSDLELYLISCGKCLRFCNCSYTYFPKCYPDVEVRSIDGELVRLTADFVRASKTLSRMVDDMMVVENGVRSFSMEALFQNKMLRLPEKDSIGITKKILKKISYFVKWHLDDVEERVEKEKRFLSHIRTHFRKKRGLIADEHIQINTFAYEEWEEKFFDVDIETFLQIRQACEELQIRDLHWTLEKWLVMFRGTPITMVNGWYDILEDPDFDETDAQNIYGFFETPYCNPFRESRHKNREYPFEFSLDGPKN